MIIGKDGAAVRNSGTLSGAPAVRITGDNVRFTNADSGRINASSQGSPAIVIEGAGVTLVNEAGGIIRAPDFDGDYVADEDAIVGSAFADIIVNDGLIVGTVRLGEGSDSYTERTQGAAASVNLDGGNDTYRFAGEFLPTVAGGSGTDRFVIDSDVSQIWGDTLSGFESLEVNGAENFVNAENFSGFSQIVLRGGSTNFLRSANPHGDITMTGGWLTVGQGSTFDDITGSSAAESVEVTAGMSGAFGAILGDVSLGSGDDEFWISWYFDGGNGPVIGGAVDAATGNDKLIISVTGNRTIDLSGFTGFERLNAGTMTSTTTHARLTHADGFLEIQNDYLGTLTIAESSSPNAVLHPSVGTVLLEASATVGTIGAYVDGIEYQAQGDDTLSTVVTNRGAVRGAVRLGLGDDLFDGRMGKTGGTIFGYAGNDRLFGGAEANRIEGGYGADQIEGNGGADILDGGAGADTFLYRRVSDSTASTTDTILGFQSGVDKIDLRAVLASSVAWQAAGGTNAVTVETTTGTMTLSVAGTLAKSDFLLPTGMILGTARDDQLTGKSGGDVIDGGLGADRMTGKGGDDTYYIENAGDIIVEAAAEGTDTARSRVSFTLGAHVEKLVLEGSAAIGAIGNAASNVLTGNLAANVLNGAAGADTMIGGKGDDSYFVDNARDVVKELDGEGTDVIYSSVSFSIAGQAVERLILNGSAATNALGNALANVLTGNGAANALDGAGGADTMNGGGGDDSYVIDNSGDRAVESSATGGVDTVRSSVTLGLGANIENLFLTGSAALNGTGNGLGNALAGNDASNSLNGGDGNDLLNGGAGGDILTGGNGDDTFIVDNIADQVVEATAGGGTDTVRSAVTWRLGDFVERLVLTGTAAVNGTGNAVANSLTGNASANTLTGGGGNDVISGGGGNDRLIGNSGADRLTGGGGYDEFIFNSRPSSSNVDAILDYYAASDSILLNRAAFASIGPNGRLSSAAFTTGSAAADASDRIIYDQAAGKLYYDADGTGAAASVLFATVTVGTALSYSEFTIYG